MSVYDTTVVLQKERNAITYFNEKVQMKNVNLGTLYFIFPKIKLLLVS